MRSGDGVSLAEPLDNLRTALISPIPSAPFLALVNYRKELRDVEGIKRLCVDLGTEGPGSTDVKQPYYSYCFDANNALLQSTLGIQTHTRTSFKNTLRFRGRFLPGDIEVKKDAIITLTAHVEAIERLTTINAVDFAPPPNAVLLPKANSGTITPGTLIAKVAPEYPVDAKAAGVQGTVVLRATINKQGHTENLSVISGPPMLQRAAVDAVRQWTYKPYVLNGSPVSVETMISVVFTLPR